MCVTNDTIYLQMATLLSSCGDKREWCSLNAFRERHLAVSLDWVLEEGLVAH